MRLHIPSKSNSLRTAAQPGQEKEAMRVCETHLRLWMWCAGPNTGSGSTANGGSSCGGAADSMPSQPGTPQPMRSSGSPRQQSLGRRYASGSASSTPGPVDHGGIAENAAPPLPPPDSWAASVSHPPQGMVSIKRTLHTCACHISMTAHAVAASRVAEHSLPLRTCQQMVTRNPR